MTTFKVSGVGFVDETSWCGIFAPKGTPKSVVDKVNRNFNRVLDTPGIKERTATLGFRLLGGPPEKLQAMPASEIAKWAEVAKTAGIMK
jgi:tripartite-type tricarboxylate transporter receptor subunit TctC